MPATIELIKALRIMDEKENGKRPTTFSIRFVKKDGEIVSLTNAVKVGSKFNQAESNMINVKQLGNSNHPYPVHIRTIIGFNDLTVRF